jgi:LmbE family N-acetylglucosaminyl deacetylase
MNLNCTPADAHRFDGCTILGMWAHPDDETYLSAGLMARTVGAGGRVACVHATRSKAGTGRVVPYPDSSEIEAARSMAGVS